MFGGLLRAEPSGHLPFPQGRGPVLCLPLTLLTPPRGQLPSCRPPGPAPPTGDHGQRQKSPHQRTQPTCHTCPYPHPTPLGSHPGPSSLQKPLPVLTPNRTAVCTTHLSINQVLPPAHLSFPGVCLSGEVGGEIRKGGKRKALDHSWLQAQRLCPTGRPASPRPGEVGRTQGLGSSPGSTGCPWARRSP